MARLTKEEAEKKAEELYAKIEALMGTENSVTTSDVAITGEIGGIVRRVLAVKGFTIEYLNDGEVLIRRAAAVKMPKDHIKSGADEKSSEPVDITTHDLVLHPAYKRIKALLSDSVPAVVQFIGPAGSGKTSTAEYLAQDLGMVYFEFPCTEETSALDLFGKNDIVPMEDGSGNTRTVLTPGVVIQAMQQGLDEDGNEVGPAGLLCLDDATALRTEVMMHFNGLNCERPRRTITYEGRKFTSHSKFRVVMTGNNAGRGNNSMLESVYTAQAGAKDASSLDRVYPFRFGYMLDAEKRVLLQRTQDDSFVDKMVKFTSMVRGAIKNGEVRTPFTTRTLVKVANLYRVIGDAGYAIRNAVYDGLESEEEMAVYSAAAQTCFGISLEVDCNDGGKIEYMR